MATDKTDMQQIASETYLDETEAIAYSGFGRRTLLRLRVDGTNKGRLPFYVVGKSIRYKRVEIDQFIEQHKVLTNL